MFEIMQSISLYSKMNFFWERLIINGCPFIHLHSHQTLSGKKFLEARKAMLLVHVLRSTQLEVIVGRSAGRWLDAAGLADDWPVSYSTGLHLVQEPCVICVGQTYVSCHKQLKKWWRKTAHCEKTSQATVSGLPYGPKINETFSLMIVICCR